MTPVTVDSNDERGTAAVVADIVSQLSDVEELDIAHDGHGVLLSVPKGRSVLDVTDMLDKHLPKPRRRIGQATITDPKSFLAHLERFGSVDSVVFANSDPDGPSLLAVYDYHPATDKIADTAFLAHRACYAPQLSEEWAAWTENDNETVQQQAFAQFIEDHITEVVVPNLDDPMIATFANLVQGTFAEPSQLLALSRGLEVNVETNVKQALNLSSGEISVIYDENHRDGAGAPLKVPQLFQLLIPVFYGGDAYRMAARLRYRVAGQRLLWSYKLVRPDLVFAHAFRGIVKSVEDTTVPVLYGAPEK